MKVSLRYSVLFLAAVTLLSCQTPETEVDQEAMHSDLKQEIASQWRLFFDAWVEGDGTKCASFFCEDGMHFRPGAEIDTGREEIGGTFSAILSSYKVEYCNQTTLEIEVCANNIIEYGVYEQKWAQSDQVTKGGYFAVWKDCEKDSLKISRLIFN
ncbi:DUF4440 domain-containing protein [Candidatus Eisenbacteria bacterium]|uniref:DUF4440 domain-containing protein n=1 Tax=Eiseniibacteriota bacterium TaxID=2212470 RepID=A0ABV6YMU6_UNCEI